MTDFQNNKALVRKYYEELDAAQGDDIDEVLRRYTTDDYYWRGMHPFYEQQGADAVAEVFWKPFRQSFVPIQRRQDIFMAGLNDVDNFSSEWICSMGHLLGLYDYDWLGIPSTGKMLFLRYAEFHRISDGKISETALFCDIISIMQQAGLHPLPLQTGAAIITPGPQSHDGLLFDRQDPEAGTRTLQLVNQMCVDLTTTERFSSEQEQLAETWHSDMLWFGPAGIGATYTIERYEEQHQGPFSKGLEDIKFNGHICRFAEGNFAAWFGWANLSAKPVGGFMGLPASNVQSEMRVVDIYRRAGDKLAENWIFIDLLYFLKQQGLDVLERMQGINRCE